VAFAVALAALFAAGLWLGGHPSSLPGPLRDAFVDEPAGLTAEAAEAIEDRYYRPVGETELGNASLQGMVRELRRRHDDRFSEYFSPEALADFTEQIEGHFSGIGVEIKRVKAGSEIVKVFRGSPAEGAGLETGDTLVSVEGKPIGKRGSAEVRDEVVGPEGTQVTLGIRDGKSGKTKQVTITRAQVSFPNVSSRTEKVKGKALGYVRMLSFSEGAHGQLANAVRKVQKEGAKGIVLDLRHNPGGLLEEAVRTASLFLPEGEVVVSTKSRSQGESTYETSGGRVTKLPLVVLIDGGTASAAEILTAALADDGGAETVGTHSFGKGVFQEEQALANGGALKLTVGEYFTPKGVNLAESHGIHPDVEVKNDPKTKADEAKERAFGELAGQVGG
jgi:carboxyl-terminal processing protease